MHSLESPSGSGWLYFHFSNGNGEVPRFEKKMLSQEVPFRIMAPPSLPFSSPLPLYSHYRFSSPSPSPPPPPPQSRPPPRPPLLSNSSPPVSALPCCAWGCSRRMCSADLQRQWCRAAVAGLRRSVMACTVAARGLVPRWLCERRAGEGHGMTACWRRARGGIRNCMRSGGPRGGAVGAVCRLGCGAAGCRHGYGARAVLCAGMAMSGREAAATVAHRATPS